MRPQRSAHTLVLALAFMATGLIGCPEDPNLEAYTFLAEDGVADALEDTREDIGEVLGPGIGDAGPETIADGAQPDSEPPDTPCAPDCEDRCGPETDGCGGECSCEGGALCHPAGVCVVAGHEETIREWQPDTGMSNGAALLSTPTWLAWPAEGATGFLPHNVTGLCQNGSQDCADPYQEVAHAPLIPQGDMQTTTLAVVDATVIALVQTEQNGQEEATFIRLSVTAEDLWTASLNPLGQTLQYHLTEGEDLVRRTFLGAGGHLWWANEEFNDGIGEITTLWSGPPDLQDISDATVSATVYDSQQGGCDLSGAFFVTTNHVWLPCKSEEDGSFGPDAASVQVRPKTDVGTPSSDILYPYEFFSNQMMGSTETERVHLLHVNDTHAMFLYKADGDCWENCSTRLYRCAYEGIGTGAMNLFKSCSFDDPIEIFDFNLAFVMQRAVFTANEGVAYLLVQDMEQGFSADRTLKPFALTGASDSFPEITEQVDIIGAALSPDGRFLYWMTESFGVGEPQRALKRALIQ